MDLGVGTAGFFLTTDEVEGEFGKSAFTDKFGLGAEFIGVPEPLTNFNCLFYK